MKRTVFQIGLGLGFGAALCLSGVAVAKTAEPTFTAEQKANFLSQATSLQKSLQADLAAAEADARAKNLSPAAITAAIQAALQTTITKSGADPRAVLAVLGAAQSCGSSGGGFTSAAVSLTCDTTNSKDLSAEAKAALSSLQTIVVAQIDAEPAPGALGTNTGVAPLTSPPTGTGGGGSTDYRS